MSRDCEHGRLARSCEACELNKADAEIARLTAEVERLRGLLSRCKDWMNGDSEELDALIDAALAEGGSHAE